MTGDILLLLASASWSAYGVLARRLNLPSAQAAALVAVISLCCFLPVYLVLRGGVLFSAPLAQLATQALVQGVLIGAVSIFVYTRAVTLLGPAVTALFTAAVPCTTTTAAMAFLHERPTLLAALGVCAVTFGVIFASRAAKQLSPRSNRRTY